MSVAQIQGHSRTFASCLRSSKQPLSTSPYAGTIAISPQNLSTSSHIPHAFCTSPASTASLCSFTCTARFA